MEIIFIIVAIIIAIARNSTGDWYDRPQTPSNLFHSDSIFESEYSDNKNYLLALFAFIIVIVFFISPIAAIILLPIAIGLYIFLKKNVGIGDEATKRRKEALLRAKVFLLPYKDIWRNLTLSNKYCSLTLQKDGITIIGIEKKQDPYLPYRKFRITQSNIFEYRELWNLFCIHFAYNKFYEGLLEDCERYKVSIYEDIITPELPKPSTKTVVEGEVVNQIDVNNCSEAELTALPGISIVISKKIIRRREEIGGFKNVKDFLNYVNLKPNVTKQLEPKICVKKMKGSLKISRNDERTLDL